MKSHLNEISLKPVESMQPVCSLLRLDVCANNAFDVCSSTQIAEVEMDQEEEQEQERLDGPDGDGDATGRGSSHTPPKYITFRL